MTITNCLLVALSATSALAGLSPMLYARQLVEIPCSEDGRKDCGEGCIPLTWTCCPDEAGGCGPLDNCWLGDNGEYGCCPLGEDCQGPGGAITTPGDTVTITYESTSTIYEGSTSTITYDESTSTSEMSTPVQTETASQTFTVTESTPIVTPIPPATINGSLPVPSTIVTGAAPLPDGAGPGLAMGLVIGVAAWFF